MTASNQGFYDVVARGLGAAALSADQRRRILAAAERPLRRAQEAGAVRDDLVPEDVQIMLRMLGAATRAGARRSPDGRPLAALSRPAAGLDAPGRRHEAPRGAVAHPHR